MNVLVVKYLKIGTNFADLWVGISKMDKISQNDRENGL